jgi:hypothetical protein
MKLGTSVMILRRLKEFQEFILTKKTANRSFGLILEDDDICSTVKKFLNFTYSPWN